MRKKKVANQGGEHKEQGDQDEGDGPKREAVQERVSKAVNIVRWTSIEAKSQEHRNEKDDNHLHTTINREEGLGN